MKRDAASTKICMTLVDNGIRIERLVWLDGLNERFSDSDLFDDLSDLQDSSHHSLGWLRTAPTWAWEDEETLIEFLQTKGPSGFIALVEVQAPFYLQADAYSASWGVTRHCWMYSEEAPGFVPLAMQFREQVHADAKRRALPAVQS